MKISTPIRTNIYTCQDLTNPENFFKRIKFRCENYPELVPEKCGFWEPLKVKFSSGIIETLIPDDREGRADSLYWSRNKKTKAWGVFSVPKYSDMHAEEIIHSELEQTDQNRLIEYVKKNCLEFNADLAIIDLEINDSWNVANPHIGIVEPTTDHLRNWLPDMYWGVVFGKPYIDLWGIEKLMKVPAFKVEKLSDSLIFIQLTEKIEDILDNPEEMRSKREEIKEFLNNYVFYSNDKGYKFSDSIWFFLGRSENNFIEIPKLGYVPKVFNTPIFCIENSDDIFQENEDKLSELNQFRLIQTSFWEMSLSSDWLVQAYPEENPDLSTGSVEQIRFFPLPEYYDLPVQRELFLGVWDRPSQNIKNIRQYAEDSLKFLEQSYPLAYSKWSIIESRIEHFDGYSEVYLDQVDQQQHNLFRIAVKLIIFDEFFVKVTYMDYWCNDIDESKAISDPIFLSFNAKELNH